MYRINVRARRMGNGACFRHSLMFFCRDDCDTVDINRGASAALLRVHSKDLCGADDGDVVRQKWRFPSRLTSGPFIG